MKLSAASRTLLLFVLATSLTASLVGQSERNSSERAAHIADAGTGKRKIPCKTPENVSLCYWTHGRLTYGNGTPPLRIWKIGTHRMLGVFNGPSHFPSNTIEDEESPELPVNLEEAYAVEGRRMKRLTGKDPGPPIVFADLEICPLRPAKEGTMQPVCIESASKIFVEPNE